MSYLVQRRGIGALMLEPALPKTPVATTPIYQVPSAPAPSPLPAPKPTPLPLPPTEPEPSTTATTEPGAAETAQVESETPSRDGYIWCNDHFQPDPKGEAECRSGYIWCDDRFWKRRRAEGGSIEAQCAASEGTVTKSPEQIKFEEWKARCEAEGYPQAICSQVNPGNPHGWSSWDDIRAAATEPPKGRVTEHRTSALTEQCVAAGVPLDLVPSCVEFLQQGGTRADEVAQCIQSGVPGDMFPACIQALREGMLIEEVVAQFGAPAAATSGRPNFLLYGGIAVGLIGLYIYLRSRK
jgi:hypothetical protein